MDRAKVLLGLAMAVLLTALLVSRWPSPVVAVRAPMRLPVTAVPVVPVHLAGSAPAAASPAWVGGPTLDVDAHPDLDPDLAPGTRYDRAFDPERVGPCPAAYEHLPVVRCGLDTMGRPTWWHSDGSFTLCAMQTRRDRDGSEIDVPVVVHGVARPHRR